MPKFSDDPKSQTGIRIFRGILWILVLLCWALGGYLLWNSQTSGSYLDGTVYVLANIAAMLLCGAALLGTINFVWGMWRWLSRAAAESWSAGRIIGRAIGGGCWRLVAAAALISAVIFLAAPTISTLLHQGIANRESARFENSITKLRAAYQAGEIDADLYIKYLVYSVNRPTVLPDTYKSNNIILLRDIITEIGAHYQDAERDTIIEALNVLSLSRMEFDPDGVNSVAASRSAGQSDSASSLAAFTDSVSAASALSADSLNKAVLSSNAHFLIYYTDSGQNAISDEAAQSLGELLEGIAANYESVLGLSFTSRIRSSEASLFGADLSSTTYTIGKQWEVLSRSGIDRAYSSSAMPVYVINPLSASAPYLAAYIGEDWYEIYTQIIANLSIDVEDNTSGMLRFSHTTPVVPFLNIAPSSLDNANLAEVLAHELGYHYASSFCYLSSSELCNNAAFIANTFPNYAASAVVGYQPGQGEFLSNYAGQYYKYIDEGPLSDHFANGYAPFPLLESYAEIMPLGNRSILSAMLGGGNFAPSSTSQDDIMRADVYAQLYENAGSDNMRDILQRTAIKSLEQSGAGSSLSNHYYLPAGTPAPCRDDCQLSYADTEWPSGSIHYFYFPWLEYRGRTLEIDADSAQNLDLMLFGETANGWQELPFADSINLGDASGFDNFFDRDGHYYALALVAINYNSASVHGLSLSVR